MFFFLLQSLVLDIRMNYEDQCTDVDCQNQYFHTYLFPFIKRDGSLTRRKLLWSPIGKNVIKTQRISNPVLQISMFSFDFFFVNFLVICILSTASQPWCNRIHILELFFQANHWCYWKGNFPTWKSKSNTKNKMGLGNRK